MKVGAVYFDASSNIVANDKTIISLTDAWASASGEPAKRVQSVHELDSDVLWLTNLTWNDFYRSGLNRHPNFRSDGWLRTLFGQITTELGVHSTNAPDSMVETVAAIAQRVTNIAIANYQVSIRSPRLNEDFAAALGLAQSNIPDLFYPYFDSVADHPSVSVIQTANYSTSSPTVTLRCNRLLHSKKILSQPVPSDTGWELERASGLSTENWLEQIKTPFLVRCTLSNVNPDVAEILSWGSGSRKVREWLTDIEWHIVREHADVSVHATLINTKTAQQLPQFSLLPSGEFASLSYTYGLIAEQIWTAIVKSQKHKTGIARYTASAAWLRARDRMTMFDYARKLHARGVVVMSYGVGNVVARYPEGGLRRTLDIATDLALLPPASKFTEARSEGDFYA